MDEVNGRNLFIPEKGKKSSHPCASCDKITIIPSKAVKLAATSRPGSTEKVDRRRSEIYRLEGRPLTLISILLCVSLCDGHSM